MGHALFHVRENRLELRRRSPEEMPVDGSWINKTGLVAEGLALQPYIHMDIRTPFGETVGPGQVEEALAETLGPRMDRYRIGGWHIQFVEDTNLGSNHRVFVDLIDNAALEKGMPGMDAGLSLEVAIEALGDLVATEKGEQNFQLLYGGKQFCYSLLYINGSPFHVLRVGEGAGAKAAVRLRRHREFAPGPGRNGSVGLKTYLLMGDPLWDDASVQELRAETFNLPAATGPNTITQESMPTNGSITQKNHEEGNSWLLHLGLAQAARQRDFAAHNRVSIGERRRNDIIRTRFRFFLALGATAALCTLVAAAYAFAIRTSQSNLMELKEKASTYQSQVDSIRALRFEKARLEASMIDLRPLWRGPMDWRSILEKIAAALPKESGIDGLLVSRQTDGGLELSFRAWVRDWNQVQSIQKKLTATKRFSSVSLSEQRKDMGTGVVIFHVTCRLERY
ncbi:MAG: hypothetical protein M3Y08_09025 [Fibrobacterota bacterium]|nr:hypothetical protein [Fibrobacterota bacterium]